MGCNCEPPPVFDVGPPPDPQHIWHLISNEPFEKVEDCVWDPFLSVSDVLLPISKGSPNLRHIPLALAALAAVLLLVLLVTICIVRARRTRLAGTSKKQQSASSDAILTTGTTGDTHWSYNSMKTANNATSTHGSMGILMYGGEDAMRYPKSIAVTPNVNQNLRSLPRHIHDLGGGPLRQSATTVRLHGEPGNYCTVGRHYEEIPALKHPAHSSVVALATPPSLRHLQSQSRTSVRKPPPTCRPPPPPTSDLPSSGASDSSLEIDGIEGSPSPKRWQDTHAGPEGRESGYGTGPSGNWVSPRLQRSSTRPEAVDRGGSSQQQKAIPLAVFAQQKATPHSMTYV